MVVSRDIKQRCPEWGYCDAGGIRERSIKHSCYCHTKQRLCTMFKGRTLPRSPSWKWHSACGTCLARSTALCLSRWCGWWQAVWHRGAQHAMSPPSAPPSTALSDAETWKLCWSWLCVQQGGPWQFEALRGRGKWEIRINGKNKQLYIKYKRAILGWLTF